MPCAESMMLLTEKSKKTTGQYDLSFFGDWWAWVTETGGEPDAMLPTKHIVRWGLAPAEKQHMTDIDNMLYP